MSKRRRSGQKRPSESTTFWGAARQPEVPPPLIVPTADPGALPRSLGDPPLAVNPEVAQRHLSAVYEEAVKAATALAAANGLLGQGD